MNTILVTGASGFVGMHLCRRLVEAGHCVVGVTRCPPAKQLDSRVRWTAIPDISNRSALDPLMSGVDFVVHLAARAHVMEERSPDPLADYLSVNVGGTQAVAESAARAGVRRLVYLSTIKVFGESTDAVPFRESDQPRPADSYAMSKFRAEEKLQQVSGNTRLETVVIRPPLIYGSGVRGNFLRMLNLIERGVPLPFAAIANSRSLISIDNLCEVIGLCLFRADCVGRNLLVSDGEDVSTPTLIRMIAAKMGRRARLFSVPVRLLRVAAVLAGRSAEIDRLCDSLCVDISATKLALDWSPTQSLDEGIDAVVRWHLVNREDQRV